MKLVKVRVTNYRNIIDSNEVEIGATTCLVGKNEAGKTAFLKALEGLNSTDSTFTDYDKVENYPRRYFADYDQRPFSPGSGRDHGLGNEPGGHRGDRVGTS